MNNKQPFLEIIDHFQDLVNKIDEIYYSERFEPDDFGGFMEGFMGKLDQAEEMLADADEWYDKKLKEIIMYSKNELHYAFEREAGKWLFDESLEWNHEKGYYADPRTRTMFHVFCEGYGYCIRRDEKFVKEN